LKDYIVRDLIHCLATSDTYCGCEKVYVQDSNPHQFSPWYS
jgi:hypothetical protein